MKIPNHKRCALILKFNPLEFCIITSSSFHTLMILLPVDPTFGDELETIYEGCYEIKNTYIFAWR